MVINQEDKACEKETARQTPRKERRRLNMRDSATEGIL